MAFPGRTNKTLLQQSQTHHDLRLTNMVHPYNKVKLERVQKLALKIIFPELNCYAERLNRANIEELKNYMMNLCKSYFTKTLETSHRLHSALPHKDETLSQTRQQYNTSCRTKIRENALLTHFCRDMH